MGKRSAVWIALHRVGRESSHPKALVQCDDIIVQDQVGRERDGVWSLISSFSIRRYASSITQTQWHMAWWTHWLTHSAGQIHTHTHITFNTASLLWSIWEALALQRKGENAAKESRVYVCSRLKPWPLLCVWCGEVKMRIDILPA